MRMMMWVALGGALGSAARYSVGLLALRVAPAFAMPYSTFAVNILGSFAAGFLAARLAHSGLLQQEAVRLFVFVGVLGGFTTFSAFTLDTLTLANSGQIGYAVFNAVGQLALGLTAVYAGWLLG